MTAKDEFIINRKLNQFEMTLGGTTSIIEYEKNGDVYSLNHAKVPAEIEGMGIGSALMEKTLKFIERQGGFFVPNCNFAKSFINQHPEWRRIMR